MAAAYTDPCTRFSIILGTGLNAAIQVPTARLAAAKFQSQAHGWSAIFADVLVNVELSMFGRDILPMTGWDARLNAAQPVPDFQPFEYLCSGRYLGEIVRLILIQPIESRWLFHGHVPRGLERPFGFRTDMMALLEQDTSDSLGVARRAFAERHPVAGAALIAPADAAFVRSLCKLVSRRAAAYVAVGIVSLWLLRREQYPDEARATERDGGQAPEVSTVAFTGSTLEKYPGFRRTCQAYLSDMMAEVSAGTADLVLMHCEESTLIGAAAAACTVGGL
jgi:hexokinase